MSLSGAKTSIDLRAPLGYTYPSKGTRMEDILLEILANTRRELAARKYLVPLDTLKSAVRDVPPAQNFAAALLARPPVALIAEVKKASPSRGVLRKDFDPVAIARAYASSGAAALSVLTDEKFFQGKLQHLRNIRAASSLPILRKDFTVDPYQVWEARVHGADAVLLIAEVLPVAELQPLLDLARELGMQALLESHDREHLDAALATGARLIGVNNRNLRSFRVDLMNTERLASVVPAARVLVSESGISSAADVARLARCGVRAVLVGETLLQADDIPRKIKELLGVGD